MIHLGERIKQSGIIIALSAASLAVFSSIIILKVELDVKALYLFLLVFSTTLTVYNIDRWLEQWSRIKTNNRRALKKAVRSSKNASRWLAVIVFFYAISLAISFLYSNIVVMLLVAMSPIVVLIYSKDSPFFRGLQILPIKRIPLLKSIYIATGWTFLAPFSMIFYQRWLNITDMVFLGILFIKLFIMSVVYDFKDVKADRKELTWTLPIKLGAKVTRRLLHLLNVIATVACLMLIVLGGYNRYTGVLVILAPYQTVMISRCRAGASEWLYFGVCDLEQSIWLLGLISMQWVVGLGNI